MIGTMTLAQMVDAVIVLTVLEGALLWFWQRRRGQGTPMHDLWANSLSGLCLMLALRDCVRGLGSGWIALCLLGAGVAHGVDLWMRWRRARPAGASDLRVTA